MAEQTDEKTKEEQRDDRPLGEARTSSSSKGPGTSGSSRDGRPGGHR